MTTKIEWTDEVWNPVTGCTKVSQGCKNCYAERLAERFWGKRKFTDVQCHPERLEIPLHWRKPRRIFVNSMSDLFHDAVPGSFIADILHVIGHSYCAQHTFQVLTKRPKRMYEFFESNPGAIIPNLQLGISAENQETANERIPWLLKTPAAVRFVSYEPALGPVYFGEDTPEGWYSYLTGDIEMGIGTFKRPDGAPKLDWVIAGGESGPGARPAHPDWFRAVRDQCRAAGIPFFFKQWGEWWPGEFGRLYNASVKSWTDGQDMWRIGKKNAGRLLDGREWNEYPQDQS